MSGSALRGESAASLTAAPLLSIEELVVAFADGAGWHPVVRGVSLQVRRGECVGLVGESGSGKSLTALALLRLLPAGARATGRLLLEGSDLQALPEAMLRHVRGARIGMIFQETTAALDPFYTIGFQLAEAVTAHRPMSRKEARRESARLLEQVAMPEPTSRLDDYPHQLSGGQRQRVMVAMALAGKPDLVLADEPTTALDVTLQAQVLALLSDLRRDLGLAVLLITHDLAVVAETCDRVAVLYAGRVVEEASVADLFRQPAHPYTQGLLATLPRLGQPAPRGQLPVLPGQPAEAWSLPGGCAFHPRCPHSMPVCATEDPPETTLPGGGGESGGVWEGSRRVRCWLHVSAPAEAPMGSGVSPDLR